MTSEATVVGKEDVVTREGMVAHLERGGAGGECREGDMVGRT